VAPRSEETCNVTGLSRGGNGLKREGGLFKEWKEEFDAHCTGHEKEITVTGH
jgi:hypothetical protein